ncbi:MAG: glutamyl-tRNA reductase [bacterium]
MNIAYVGCSFQHFAVKDLEKLYISKQDTSHFYHHIKQTTSIKSICLLMTCNRVEFYFESDHLTHAKKELLTLISTFKNIPEKTINDMITYKEKYTALEHLFKVSCGIKSMVFGENEILSQVKSAYELYRAQNQNTALLNKVFQSAIATGKRTRTETQISQGSYSISSIAIEAVRERCLDYFAHNILIIGAGIIAERLIKKWTALGHPSITICNRTATKALKLAQAYQLKHLPPDELKEKVKNYSIIFTATSSKDFILNEKNFTDTISSKYFLIDLGVPRNINPNVDHNPLLSRLTITNLQEVADKNIHRRKKELEKCETIINEELEKVKNWLNYKQQHPA